MQQDTANNYSSETEHRDEKVNQFDVLVVGAGMVGAAVANGLAFSNMRIAVIDTAPAISTADLNEPDIRVSAISYTSEQILKNLGAWKYLEHSRLCLYKRLGVAEDTGGHSIFDLLPGIKQLGYTEFNSESIGKTHLGHIAENLNIQHALHQAMRMHSNITLYCPDEIQELARSDSGAQVKLKSGESLFVSLVVGADGANSKVRNWFNIPASKDKYQQEAFVCTAAHHGQREDITWQTFFPTGPRAFLPLAEANGSQYASLVWYDEPKTIDALMQMNESELVDAISKGFPDKLPRLKSICKKGRFPLYKSHVKQYYKPGVVLVGDAAHTINPLAGQGVNLGFMDAAVLVENIVQSYANGEGVGSTSALEKYQRSRKVDNQAMMNIMDAFYYGFSNDHLPLKVLRHAGLSAANKLDFAKNKVMQFAVGTIGDLPKLARPV